jgi:hypothetical protein
MLTLRDRLQLYSALALVAPFAIIVAPELLVGGPRGP